MADGINLLDSDVFIAAGIPLADTGCCPCCRLMDKCSMHSGRTAAAHNLAERGAILVELQEFGRWKSPSMPATYAPSARAGQNAVARMLEI